MHADRWLAFGDSGNRPEYTKEGVLNDRWRGGEHRVLGGDRPHRRDIQQAGHGFGVDASLLGEGEVQLIEPVGAGQRRPELKPDAHLVLSGVGERVLGPPGHIDSVARAEHLAGAVDGKRCVPGKHLEMLILMRMDVGHSGEPAGREDAFGREQLAVGVRGRDQEDEPLPGDWVLDDLARVCHATPFS